jgi:hypothetical protein
MTAAGKGAVTSDSTWAVSQRCCDMILQTADDGLDILICIEFAQTAIAFAQVHD